MSEVRYNNRQIEKMLGDSVHDIKEHITLHIDPLTKQVTKTNGRVKWLEKMMFTALGALAILSPVAGWFFFDYLKFKDSFENKIQSVVSDSVSDALDDYEFELKP